MNRNVYTYLYICIYVYIYIYIYLKLNKFEEEKTTLWEVSVYKNVNAFSRIALILLHVDFV